MGSTAFYLAKPSEHLEESIKTCTSAIERGMMVDTAWIYQSQEPGALTNEEVVGKAVDSLIAKGMKREDMKIATKFGITFGPAGLGFNSSPENIESQLNDSLKRLGDNVKYIDLYYQHRVDPAVPMETVANKLKELVAAGKIKAVGLSEASPEEIRKVHAIVPVTAVQVEFSLSNREAVLSKLVPVCKELGVAIVCYSPLGRGILAGKFKKNGGFDEGDWRKTQPRFSEENLATNISAADKLATIAHRLGATSGQLALAYLLKKGQQVGVTVVPIPGTKSTSRLEENAGAVALADKLTDDVIAELEASVPEFVGDRYSSGFGTWETRL
jgi:aryl-alcohol dehydrogenase-like predicted oxidoreductase